MATSSNEFAALVNQLHKAPNDPALKKAVVEHLPKMVSLAQDSPMSLYHLAHIYPPKSSQYKQTMRESANLGCTNAMLVMCQVLAESNEPSDWKKAVHYLTRIEKSNDSYIKEQAQSLVQENPQLMNALNDKNKHNLSHNISHRFFKPQADREISVDLIETESCKI
jgi:hypothetical protein